MTIDGKKVAFLVSKEGIEQVELTEPWKVVERSGGVPQLISIDRAPCRHTSTWTRVTRSGWI